MELERTFDDNVYSNVDDGSVFPLFVRVALFIDGKKIETASY